MCFDGLVITASAIKVDERSRSKGKTITSEEGILERKAPKAGYLE